MQGGALTATLPAGAYSVTDLCLALATAMDTADGVQTYQVSYLPTTIKISIICTVAIVLNCTVATNAM
jgi:hypothetical protein